MCVVDIPLPPHAQSALNPLPGDESEEALQAPHSWHDDTAMLAASVMQAAAATVAADPLCTRASEVMWADAELLKWRSLEATRARNAVALRSVVAPLMARSMVGARSGLSRGVADRTYALQRIQALETQRQATIGVADPDGTNRRSLRRRFTHYFSSRHLLLAPEALLVLAEAPAMFAQLGRV